MEKEQGKLIIIVSVVFAMVLLCMICTSDSVPRSEEHTSELQSH